MKTILSIISFNSSKKTIITIGTFDGVHIGHKKILEKIILNAKEQDCESLVLTFFPHPRIVLYGNDAIKLLNTIEEKKALLENIGIDNLIIHPFDLEFSKLSAEEFVKSILVEKLNVKKIVIGYDHRFGNDRTADINDLITFGKKYHFEVEQISAEQIDENAVSSTKIRNALLEGNIELANQFLGYHYSFSGTVVKGNQLGRTIGFPTANIKISEEYKLIPKYGVYVVKCLINDKEYFGMMNIGTRPTVDGKNTTIEVHLLNFEKDIYDEKIVVEVIKKIRDEQKFDSFELLKLQIQKDKETSLNYISSL